MLPGLRQLLLAIIATVVLTAFGLGQLARYEVAQTHSAKLPPQEARFAGLAFAARADWTPEHRTQRVSLERLAPFDSASIKSAPIKVPPPVPARVDPDSGIETAIASLAAAPTASLARRPSGVPDAIAPTSATATAVPPALPEHPPSAIPAGRIVYAALALPASVVTSISTEAAEAESAAPAAELVRIVIQRPDRPSIPSGLEIGPAPATVIAEISTIPLSEVKLPVPRPRLAKASPPAAKPTAAKPKRATTAKTRAPRRQARRAPTPAPPKPKDPFADLFAEPGPTVQPRN